jgi:hypothetical protein
MAAGPGISCAIYLTITSLYFIIKIFISSIDNVALLISYICLVILGQFFINVDITKSTCGESNFGVAAFASTVPWIVVLGSISVLLNVFPGWLIPFSNTIGFVIVSAAGISTFFNEILTPDVDTKFSGDEKKSMYKTLEKIYNNKSLLINELSRQNLPNFWKNMKKAGIIEQGAGEINMSLYNPDLDKELYKGDTYKNFSKLFNYLKMKDTVSEFIWFALTGTLVCSMSYNYIQNMGCFRSVEEMKQTHDDYINKENEIKDEDKNDDGNPQTVYTTFE